MKANIEISKVTKRFGSFTAVEEFDLTVEPGEVICLLGPSGCGKTTSLRMIAGLETPTSGVVTIAGKDVTHMAPEQRDIAMVFQFYALYPALSIKQNIAFPLYGEGLSESAREERIRKVADIMQLTDVLDRRPGQIAEGEKQRAAVARAIVRDPSCFLFDEPLSRLDVELRESMRGQIKEVLQGLSKPTVIVTHDQLEALTMADRITIMRDGRIEQIGTPHDVFAKPANAFVASFIGTPQMNLLDAEFVSANGQTAKVKLGNDTLELSTQGALGLVPGPIQIGVRPRAFTVQNQAGPNAISVVSELIEPMGAETMVHARTRTNEELRVVVPRTNRIALGEQLFLVPDAAQTHVFDTTGKAVRP